MRLLSSLSVLLVIALAQSSSADDWTLVPVPDSWRSVPAGELTPINGYSWYRALVRLPTDWKGEDLTLFVEALDDARSAWVNGQTVGAAGTFPPQFRSGLGERGRFAVPAATVGDAEFVTIAIRVYQSDPRPNFSVAPPVLLNESKREALRLEGVWLYRPGDDSNWANASLADFGVDAMATLSDIDAAARGLYQQVDTLDDIEAYVTRRKGDTERLSPEEAVKHFKTPDDLSVQLVLSDPVIAQPLHMSWDERGRLWLVEYRQYPDPAGLKMVSRDTFLRTVYDKVPLPPPHHDRGADRISVHEDTNGDGVYDSHKVFVDELNIATSAAVGRGGVFVTNPPYLLFYPDRNGDDIPDGDPEVLLEGFGIEDSHSVINSLRFGPDGWLYGAQGSTVTGNVREPGSKAPAVRSLGQLIWRYHPEERRYEIFAEGGGNTFGCEIDDKGRVFSGHNGGDTRGFHYVQGGYYRKGFGKHGPLSNPYAFGFFEQMKHHSVPRFTHNFIIYEERVLPQRFQGQLFGVEPLQGQVVLSSFRPQQSSFETEDIERVLTTDDPWFRPVDIKAGPDGSIYVADMYEQRIDHSSHYAGRIDKTSGRIYRLHSSATVIPAQAGIQSPRVAPSVIPAQAGIQSPRVGNALDPRVRGDDELSVLHHPSKWHRQTAIRVLGDRRDATLIPQLRDELQTASGQTALELLWAINACGGLTDDVAIASLKHSEPFVRAWTVRLVCDRTSVSQELADAMRAVAANEPYIDVRKQLASSARRLPPELALPIIRELLRYDEDTSDIHQPLLIWWAIESQAGQLPASQLVSALLSDAEGWNKPLVAEQLLERMMKRYALAGSRQDLLNAAALLELAPDKTASDRLLMGFEAAFQGRSLAGLPDELITALARSGGGSLALRLRQAQPEAVAEAITVIGDRSRAASERQPLVEVSGQSRLSELLPVLLELVTSESDTSLRSAIFAALQNYDDPAIAPIVIARFAELSDDSALAAESLLVSRAAWSRELLRAIDDGTLAKSRLSDSAVRRMSLHNDSEIQSTIERLWGTLAGLSPAAAQAEIVRVRAIVDSGSGNPRNGKRLFMQHCGRCHLLFEEGGRVGPDLTAFDRTNLERMLTSIVNPSLEIREGFENFAAVTTDGRVLNGFLADKDSQVVILRGVDGQNVILRHDEIEDLHAVPQSVMPDGALKPFDDQQLRDVFAYLRSSQPVNY